MKKYTLIIVILLAVALIALTIITSGHREKISTVEGFVGDIVTPVQEFMYRIATRVSNFSKSIKERRQLEDNYNQLLERVDQLEKELLQFEEVKKENARLKELLNFETDEEFIMVGARVTGKDPGNWFNIFTIDKGTNDGVKVDSAVVTDKGLVGRVISVGKNWAKVRSIVDGQSSVSGIVERTRDIGMVRGNNGLTYEDGLCRMVHLPTDSDIIIGDQIITSGLGEIFPKGILIGEVIEATLEKRDPYKTAIIQPAVDFRRLEEVIVIYTVEEEKS